MPKGLIAKGRKVLQKKKKSLSETRIMLEIICRWKCKREDTRTVALRRKHTDAQTNVQTVSITIVSFY